MPQSPLAAGVTVTEVSGKPVTVGVGTSIEVPLPLNSVRTKGAGLGIPVAPPLAYPCGAEIV